MTSQPPPQYDPESGKEIWKVDMIEASYGQFLVREGEEADSAFIIKEGIVEVLKKRPDGQEIHIARLGLNEMFGEMCLFEEQALRSASVRVISEQAIVMSISKHHFQRQMATLPETMRNIITVLVKRLRNANHHISMLS